jgi:drug/metabolite transporter (DMT)-like permease
VLLAPLATIVLEAVVLGEPIRPVVVAGGLLVLAGVYFGVVRSTGR